MSYHRYPDSGWIVATIILALLLLATWFNPAPTVLNPLQRTGTVERYVDAEIGLVCYLGRLEGERFMRCYWVDPLHFE